MPTLEETRKMVTIESEVSEAQALLSDELKKSRETIDVFLLTMSQLEQNLNAFRAFLSQKFNITVKAAEFLRDVSMAAINYQAHFLNNFQRLLWKLKEYLHTLPKEQRIQNAKFHALIEQKNIEIEKYKEKIDSFIGNCLRTFRTGKRQILTNEEMNERLDNALAILLPFAQEAPKEVFKHLIEMEDIIIKSRILIQR